MAVKTYLQSAITHVQSAMADMQTQVNGMRQNADSRKKQLQQDVMRLESEHKAHLAEFTAMQNDSQRSVLHDRANNIAHQIDEKKAEMNRIDAEVASALQRKDQLSKDLYNANGELMRLAALPDIG